MTQPADLTNAVFAVIKATPGVTVKEIAEQLNKPCRGVKVAVSNLAAKEKIESDFAKRGVPARYTATYQAPQMAQPMNGPGHTMKPLGKLAEPTSVPLRNSTKKGDYDGAELGRNPGLTPDRFEAFELPSMVNGVRVPPKRITAMCVGATCQAEAAGGSQRRFAA
jgi:hypothetical protein